MTRYSDELDTPVAFPPQAVDETMAQVLAENGLRQLHAAETEKYAHVTYFFNGGREEEWPGETRLMVPSAREVGTYDKKPEMSASRWRSASVRRSSRTARVSRSSTSPIPVVATPASSRRWSGPRDH
jgi:2,3-bisphosphoglycerate-independent phosphoglycerate mutase